MGKPDKILTDNIPQIQALMRHYGVQKAYAFGSAVKGTMTAESDVDFIIRFPSDIHFETYYDNYVGLMHSLEDLLHKEIELVSEETLQNKYLIQSIDSHKMQLL